MVSFFEAENLRTVCGGRWLEPQLRGKIRNALGQFLAAQRSPNFRRH